LRYFVFILATTLVLGSLAATAARADDVQAKLQAAYDSQCKGFIAKDATAFQKTFDPKYESTDLDGKHETLADILDEITAPTPGITIATCAFTIRKVTVSGTTATVLVTATATGTIAQDGTPAQPLVQVQDTTDTWNVAAAPVELTSVETGVRATAGGKVVQEKGTLSTPPGGR
jgi:hypothetical protein